MYVARFCVAFCGLMKKQGGFHEVEKTSTFGEIVKKLKKVAGIPE